MTKQGYSGKAKRGLCFAVLGIWIAVGCSTSDAGPGADAGDAGVSHAGDAGVSHPGDANVTDAARESGPDAGVPPEGGAANSGSDASGDLDGGPPDASLDGDTTSNAGASAGGADADGGPIDLDADNPCTAELADAASPYACPSGACVPADPCHVGVLTCTDAPACLDTQVNLLAGTSCGAGSVCSATGTCELVACQPVPANLPNCVADKPCHIGYCGATSPICTDLSTLSILPPARDGTPCGVPNRIGECEQGECVVDHCLANGGACDIACAGPSGAALPEGARCGANSVCLSGKCTTELAVSGVPFPFVAGARFCGVVANLSDENLADTTATLVASVAWGDGSTSAGQILGTAGSFTVSASHVFALSGTYQVTVAVMDVRSSARADVSFGVSDHILEFTPPGASYPGPIAVGKDGNIWFGNGAGVIGRITPTGAGFTSFTAPGATTSAVAGIASSSDGNLWFTLDRANSVGRMTPEGIITEFPVPTADSGPGAIAAGAEGNLWFLEDIGNVGRVTPSGTITEFSVGDHVFGGASGPRSTICLGPDNQLWFTEYVGSKIGWITAQGSVTEFPTPTPSSYPTGITTGPDGNLWFLELAANMIVRATPSGVFTEFPTNRDGSVELSQITSGPDGNLWVIEYSSNQIARVTPAGVITQFAIPTPNSQGAFITSSPTALWFTEQFKGKIGRLIP